MTYIRKILMAMTMLATNHATALEKVSFVPQWTAQAQFAGYFVAKEKGFYEQEGLDVNIKYPTYSQSSISMLKNGECQFTTTQLLDAICTIDQGTELVNILQTSQQSGLVLVGYNGKNPEKMKQGAKVGIWNAGFSLLSIMMNKSERKDFQFVRFTNNVSLFMSGAIDATLAMSYNELLQLRQANVNLKGKTVYRFSEHGYDIPEDGLYVTRKYMQNHPMTCRKFARATQRGWQWCRQHPQETLEIVMKYIRKNNILTNKVIQRLMLDEVLRLNTNPKTGKPSFALDRKIADKAIDMLRKYNLISHELNYKDITE